ncbi:MAG: SGNH/GDSL hydrolase family protein [Pirellulaceae bacterium]
MRHPAHRLTRRSLLQSSVAAGAALAVGSVATHARAKEQGIASLPEGAVVLFQGDSITDAGRDRNSANANHPGGLGRGYPFLIAGGLLRDHATSGLKVFNRGISGNKVPDLQKRWQQDCVDLEPNVLSILIGVNDIWHKLNGRYDGSVADYESGFRQLLQETMQKLPDTRVVICEPFVLRCGAVKDNWFPEFDERRAAAKKLADELKLTFVPFQSMFDEATKQAPPQYWAGDGVHPTLAGHSLMARTWRQVTGL